MHLEEFAEKNDVSSLSEAERAVALAYFHYAALGTAAFSLTEVGIWFDRLHFSIPNKTRLKQRLLDGRLCTKSGAQLKLHARTIAEWKKRLPNLHAAHDVPVASSAILPLSLLSGTRGYLEALARQINASYDGACFDACAVLMRRTLEVLLILTFRTTGEESKILSSAGSYDDLSAIINKALSNPTIGLSKQARDCVDKFRLLGNFSAHKIEYTCRRDDIKPIAADFRAMVEELLYKADLKR